MKFRMILSLLKLAFQGVLSRAWEVSWGFNNLSSLRVSNRITSDSVFMVQIRVRKMIVCFLVIRIFRVVPLRAKWNSILFKLLSWT
jgi:hypothetical protein